jgi:hypothetical protein
VFMWRKKLAAEGGYEPKQTELKEPSIGEYASVGMISAGNTAVAKTSTYGPAPSTASSTMAISSAQITYTSFADRDNKPDVIYDSALVDMK